MQVPSDLLHPWRSVTNAVGAGPAAGLARRFVSRLLYDHLARAYPHAEWTTMNYGYALRPGEPWADDIAVDPGQPEHLALQLYGRSAAMAAGDTGASFAGLDVLEVGSGRGGGAVHVARRFGPRRMVALDVSPAATRLARELHGPATGVEFTSGDAENLPFAAGSFDVVLNVESAHCYGSLARFLANVHRVLRLGGRLAFADFVSRRHGAADRLRTTLARAPFHHVEVDDVTANVVLALELDEARKRALLTRRVRGWMRSFAAGAYAMEGSAMRRELISGQTVYLAALLRKAG